MTHPTTNERLAELREAAAEDRLRPCGQRFYEFGDVIVGDDDVRGLLARLDAAEASASSWMAYAELFGEQIDRMIGHAIASGWRGDPDLHARGKALRAQLGIPEKEATDG